MINDDLKAVRRIQEVTLKNLFITSEVTEEGSERVNMFDIEAHEERVRPIPDGDFVVVQLDDNLARSVKIRLRLLSEIKTVLIKCIQTNANPFIILPHKILDIDPSIVFHQYNFDPNYQYILRKRKRLSPDHATTSTDMS